MPQHHKRHPPFARYYARVSKAMDTGGMAEFRNQTLAGSATPQVTGPAIRDP